MNFSLTPAAVVLFGPGEPLDVVLDDGALPGCVFPTVAAGEATGAAVAPGFDRWWIDHFTTLVLRRHPEPAERRPSVTALVLAPLSVAD